MNIGKKRNVSCQFNLSYKRIEKWIVSTDHRYVLQCILAPCARLADKVWTFNGFGWSSLSPRPSLLRFTYVFAATFYLHAGYHLRIWFRHLFFFLRFQVTFFALIRISAIVPDDIYSTTCVILYFEIVSSSPLVVTFVANTCYCAYTFVVVVDATWNVKTSVGANTHS